MPDDTKETSAREYSDITRAQTLSLCSLLAVIGGCIAVGVADSTNVHLIGGGYASVVIGAIGWGALHGHAKIMEREQRHHKEIVSLIHDQVLPLLERIATLLIEHDDQTLAELYNTGPRRDMLARLERIEQRQEREIDALNGALDTDEVNAHRRRNGR